MKRNIAALNLVLFSMLLLSVGVGCPPLDTNTSVASLKGLLGGCQGCEPRAGMEKTILLPGDVPLVLVWIPSGSFMMGRYPDELDSHLKEDPQHEVTFASGFWMGKYEVTQVQWLAVRNTWPSSAPSMALGQGPNHPAYYISWDDAHHFIASLNTHIAASGQGPLTFRLPSEAEWEYACRAGTQTRFYWGDDLEYADIEDYAWFTGNAIPAGTRPVGQKLPNAFGLYDMSGNILEWCEDDLHNSYSGAPAFGSAWVNAPRNVNRMLRGGAYNHSGSLSRSAYRLASLHGVRYAFSGFRVAAD